MIRELLFVCSALVLVSGQSLISEAPQNVSVGLGNNVTITCSGDGRIVWTVGDFQVREQVEVDILRNNRAIYVEAGRLNFSTVVVTGTAENNGTLIICEIQSGDLIFGPREESGPVFPLVYGIPGIPSNLKVEAQGPNFNLTWTPPFIHERENVSYRIEVRKRSTGESVTVFASEPPFLFDQVFGQRDCSIYDFTVVAVNDVGQSVNGILASEEVPTGPRRILRRDVTGMVSLSGDNAQLTLTFPVPNFCLNYPVTRYLVVYRTFTDSSDLSTPSEQRRDVPYESNVIVIGSSLGLVANRQVVVRITAENSVGSSVSEDLTFFTSSVQSVSVVINDSYVGEVTCNYASGTLNTTGCVVSFSEMDSTMSSTSLFSVNITLPDTVLTDVVFVPVPEGSMIVATVQDILSDGSVGTVLVPANVMGPFTPTSPPPTVTMSSPVTPPTTLPSTSSTVQATSATPTPLITQETLYIIIGAGGGGIALLVLLIIAAICCLCCCNRRNKGDYSTVHVQKPTDDLSTNHAYVSGGQLAGANGVTQRKRDNTYIENDNSDLTVSQIGPAYATIDDAKKQAKEAGASLAPNPIYATATPSGSNAKLVNGSQTTLADNPVYSDTKPPTHKPCTDVSALNPIYSGSGNTSQGPVPVGPRPPGFPYKSSDSPLSPTQTFAVPQPSLSGSSSTVQMSQSQSASQLNHSQSIDVVPPHTDPLYSYAEIRGHPSMRARNAVSTSSELEKPSPVKRNESYGMLTTSMSPPSTPAPLPPQADPSSESMV